VKHGGGVSFMPAASCIRHFSASILGLALETFGMTEEPLAGPFAATQSCQPQVFLR